MKKIKSNKKLSKINKVKAEVFEIFENEDFGALTLLEKDGEPWFIAKEIADILEYKKTNNMTHRLDDDEKANTVLSSINSNQQRNQTVINESGLYEAIWGSKLPKAKVFKKWIKTEVLPAIRKTGSYSMSTPKTFPEALRAYADEVEAKLLLEEKIKKEKHLVVFANQVMESADNIDLGIFAKLVKDEHIDIGRNRLFRWLKDNKYLQENNIPYQTSIESGLFVAIETVYDTAFGKRLSQKTMVTPKGQVYLTNKLKKEF